MNSSFLRLGWRTLWRDVRAGELRLLIVAVTLAVGALTAVGFFADRLQGGLQRDARQLLGGDAVISSDNPTPQRFIDQARAAGVPVSPGWGGDDFTPSDRRENPARMTAWLRALPKPCGIFIGTDGWSLRSTTAARSAGPDDLAFAQTSRR